MGDFIDKLAANPDDREQTPDGEPCAVFPRRARDTAEHEQMERDYFNSPLGGGPHWPIPFFDNEDDEYPAKLHPHEVLQLGKCKPPLSEAEWRELVKRAPKGERTW